MTAPDSLLMQPGFQSMSKVITGKSEHLFNGMAEAGGHPTQPTMQEGWSAPGHLREQPGNQEASLVAAACDQAPSALRMEGWKSGHIVVSQECGR